MERIEGVQSLLSKAKLVQGNKGIETWQYNSLQIVFRLPQDIECSPKFIHLTEKISYHPVSLSNYGFTRAAQLFSSRFVSESGSLCRENDFFSFLRKSRFKNISVVFSKAPSAAFQISKVCLVAISHECTLNVKHNCLNSFV